MKCPNCGKEMKEDQLYCESCGEEIHIVPDFEPEIENSIHKTLTGIVSNVLLTKDNDELNNKKKKTKRILKFCLFTFLLLFIVTISFLIIRSVQNHSVNYQLRKAEACIANGNTKKAISFYERAYRLNDENIPVLFTLCDLYKACGQEEEYMNGYMSVIHSEYASEDEIETAYKKVIAAYKEKNDFASINTLLMSTTNNAIRNMFQTYMAMPPEFSYLEGTYAEVIPLKLTSSTQGTIYYTVDGTIPNNKSNVYTTPIFLETGEYVITAVFINEYGIESEVIAKTYHIDVIRPPAPEVETYSGEYDSPVMIKVKVISGDSVYYTCDGTEPSNQSILYNGAIPMPLGKSTYKFIAYNEDGVAGDITVREYDLELDTDFTKEQAVYLLINQMIASGKIINDYGNTTSELNGRYLYVYRCVQAIKEEGIFYIIDEVLEDSAGVQNKTGTTYAVNVNTKEYYKLSIDVLDNYILEPID